MPELSVILNLCHGAYSFCSVLLHLEKLSKTELRVGFLMFFKYWK